MDPIQVYNPDIREIITKMILDKVLTIADMEAVKIILELAEKNILISESKYDQLSDITEKLVMGGIITRDYSDPGKIKLNWPLYITEEQEAEKAELNNQTITRFVTDHVEEYRNIFAARTDPKPIGLIPGALGDKLQCITKLVWWFKETKFQYSWEQVLNTARKYVHSQKRNNYQYLQAADYFISKNGRSRLSSLIDEYGDISSNDSGTISRHA